MNPHEQIPNLIAALYDAALEPARWPEFLEMFAAAAQTTATAMLIHDSRAHHASVAAAVRVDPVYLAEYERYYSSINIWRRLGDHLYTAGAIVASAEVCTEQELKKTEFYEDYLRRVPALFSLGAVITQQEHVECTLTALRPAGTGDFGGNEIQLLQALIPHLQRAVKIHDRLAGKVVSLAVLEHLSHGVLLLNRAGRVVFSNEAALTILNQNDGLRIQGGRLAASLQTESASLQQIVGDACHPEGDRNGSGALPISRKSGRRPFLMLVAPMRGAAWEFSGVSQPAAIVFLTDPESGTCADESILGKLFGLTPAESKLCIQLCSGADLEHSAEQLRIRYETARTHLRRVFSKTGTTRQGELIRLLMTTPTKFSDSR